MTDYVSNINRRDFVKSSVGAGAAAFAGSSVLAAVGGYAGGSDDTLRIGVIGCGGRGKGAAHDALEADSRVRIVALADAFENQDGHKGVKPAQANLRERGQNIADDNCFVGFDAYRHVIDSDVDAVIIATPPHFRPAHFAYAIAKGRHVFFEKPVAVDPVGVRTVIAAADEAKRKNLSVVTGTQRRHEQCYLELLERLRDGAIGDVRAGRVSWNQGSLWKVDQESQWSDMEWQLRNWLYFTWLSGDHIVEQHVHNLDVANWVLDATPQKCIALGGRQTRTDPAYGHIFDHFAVEYDYGDGRFVESFCRQQDGCASRVSESFVGSSGHCWSGSTWAQIHGENPWRFEGKQDNPYVVEHRDLIASIYGEGEYLNEAKRVAESTLTAIMGRMAAYTGKEVTWEKAMSSELRLGPEEYAWGDLPMPPVAEPGRTPLV